MSERVKILAFVILIVISGLSSRFFTFQSAHPDSDEMFELAKLQFIKPADIFKKDTFYGDHTSFPGEYIVHYLPLKALGLFDKPAHIDIQNQKVEGIKKPGFWVLAIPKIIIAGFGIFLFYLICARFMKTSLGYVVSFSLLMFNGHLIYHAFSLRPYGILTELAIINIYLSMQDDKSKRFYFAHILTVFFTCIYHAYGPLIAVLPILTFRKKRFWDMIIPVSVALSAWIYYAAYNTFGMSPNKVQSVVDTFQFITKEKFINGILDTIFGGSIIIAATVPLILLGALKLTRDHLFWLLLMILLPLTLIILVDIKTSYWIHPRQYIWLLPAIALWCGSVAEEAITYDRRNTGLEHYAAKIKAVLKAKGLKMLY